MQLQCMPAAEMRDGQNTFLTMYAVPAHQGSVHASMVESCTLAGIIVSQAGLMTARAGSLVLHLRHSTRGRANGLRSAFAAVCIPVDHVHSGLAAIG